VALLDSARKKCRALEGFRDALGLTNVFVTWTRCEEHALTARETYALAAARALAHVGVLAEYLSPLTVHGGRLLAFKGPKGPAELVQVGDQWDKLGLSRPYVLPYDPMARAGAELERRDYSFIIWEKNAPCPSLYPRKPGLALSKNWWHQEQAH
jgi:16S rRNA (guanine527-N7)-methyltransferase